LLDGIVLVLDLAHDDLFPSSGIDGVESGYIRATLIDGNFLWILIPLDCLFEKPSCRDFVAMP